jgi:predicted GNAT superfamily acetyltransferase
MKSQEDITLRYLETPGELEAVEALQRLVWTGSETEIVPVSMLLAAIHGGGLAIGAFTEGEHASPLLVGVVFGFPGFYTTPDGPRLKHCSHILGIHPEYRDHGIGFRLKRAQWQMVRNQGIDRITWTYDPLLSRNAYLNISKLGAVCNIYLPNFYGEMRDGLNVGLASDRFEVDWWVYSRRVERRLSRRARRQLKLDDFLKAEAQIISAFSPLPSSSPSRSPLLLVEIPVDFQTLRATQPALAQAWRLHTGTIFEDLFTRGYLVTDLVFERTGETPSSYYVLSHGEATL